MELKNISGSSIEEFLITPRKAILTGSMYLFLKDVVEGEMCSLEYMKVGEKVGLWNSHNPLEELEVLKQDIEFLTKTKDIEKLEPEALALYAIVEVSNCLDKLIEEYNLGDGNVKKNIENLLNKSKKSKAEKVLLRFILRLSNTIKNNTHGELLEIVTPNDTEYIG